VPASECGTAFRDGFGRLPMLGERRVLLASLCPRASGHGRKKHWRRCPNAPLIET